MNIKFAPSLMCMDLMNVQQQIIILNKYCNYYHIDIMDGHFVKNLCLSIDFIKGLKNITNLPLDCHLMTTNPEEYINQLIDIGVDCISLHVETLNGQAFRLIEHIKQAGIKFGIVLNPETDINIAESYLHFVDLLTIMSVDPGFAGQKFIIESLDKVRRVRNLKNSKKYRYKIAVDGGCNEHTFRELTNAGTECFIVGGSGLFNLHSNIGTAYNMMLENYKKSCLVM
ncbi:D-allulose 6-phosphate 3-epimerase [Pectinatus sottacetonis]|uniref:D-allulose 6-phosphate 3-epimerase n=1 Tax=Pectinatus sottacetonis TaxID=1002795 RepID=UPI001E53974A|nr:D-allulose 6-phosphate 3-epimerase [Pectinatus sottacetonis]